MMKLTERELVLVGNALRAAREVYENDAKVMRAAGQKRLEDQFIRQAQDCDDLAERIGEVVGI